MHKHSWWHRNRRRVLTITGFVLLGLVVVALIGLIWIRSDSGRAFIARRIETFANEQIKGTLKIGSLVRADSDGMHILDLRIVSPAGNDAIVVDDVFFAIDYWQLFRSNIIAKSGIARGGVCYLRSEAGGLGIDLAFRARGESDSVTTEPPVDFRNIAFSGMRVVGDVDGAPSFRGQALAGSARVWIDQPGAKAELTVRSLSGSIDVATPVPIAIGIRHGSVRFDGAARDRADVDLRGTMGGSNARLEAHARVDGDSARARVTLHLPAAIDWLSNVFTVLQGSLAGLGGGIDFSVEVGD